MIFNSVNNLTTQIFKYNHGDIVHCSLYSSELLVKIVASFQFRPTTDEPNIYYIIKVLAGPEGFFGKQFTVTESNIIKSASPEEIMLCLLEN